MEQHSRADAAALLLGVAERALNPAEHADIEAWIEKRDEEEGGFLWLAAMLGVCPGVIADRLFVIFHATPRERQRLRQRLTKGQTNGNGAA